MNPKVDNWLHVPLPEQGSRSDVMTPFEHSDVAIVIIITFLYVSANIYITYMFMLGHNTIIIYRTRIIEQALRQSI